MMDKDTKDYMAAEDMDALNAALDRIRAHDKDTTDPFGDDVHLMLREYDRMRRKLDEITNGETTMWLSDADRALPVMDLSDAALLAWARPTIAFITGIQKKIVEERGEPDGINGLTSMNGLISLARMCTEMNAGHVAYSVEAATDSKGELGDWRVIIERADHPTVSDMIEALCADEGDSILFVCENPDGSGHDNNAVDANGGWTDYADVRYWGETREEALIAAYEARRLSDSKLEETDQGDDGPFVMAPDRDIDPPLETTVLIRLHNSDRDQVVFRMTVDKTDPWWVITRDRDVPGGALYLKSGPHDSLLLASDSAEQARYYDTVIAACWQGTVEG